MKKSFSNEAPAPDSHLNHFTDESPFVQWIEQNGKSLLLGFFALIALLFAVYQFSSSSNAQAEADYNEAAKQYALFQKENDKAAFEKLENILTRRKELHPKYDGLIAQILLDRNEPALAKQYAEKIFKRVSSDQIPYYEEFAAISLLIAEENYSKALQKSKQMKLDLLKEATLEKDRSFGDILFAYNLLRIAMLAQKSGTPADELAAWDEWKTFSQSSTNSALIQASSFQLLNELFAEGSLTLADYIKIREKNNAGNTSH